MYRMLIDEHYLDFIRHTLPEIYNSDDKVLLAHTLQSVRMRREHAHVWNSESFLMFMTEVIRRLELRASIEFVSEGKSNNFECFVLLRKNA